MQLWVPNAKSSLLIISETALPDTAATAPAAPAPPDSTHLIPATHTITTTPPAGYIPFPSTFPPYPTQLSLPPPPTIFRFTPPTSTLFPPHYYHYCFHWLSPIPLKSIPLKPLYIHYIQLYHFCFHSCHPNSTHWKSEHLYLSTSIVTHYSPLVLPIIYTLTQNIQ